MINSFNLVSGRIWPLNLFANPLSMVALDFGVQSEEYRPKADVHPHRRALPNRTLKFVLILSS